MRARRNPIQVKHGAILAIQLGDIGDVVLTLPALRALKKRFPRNRVVVCVRKKASELMALCPDVDAVITVDKTKRSLLSAIRYQLAFLSSLKSHRYDLSIDFRTGTRGAIASLMANARYRLGFFEAEGKMWRNRIFTHLVHRDYQLGTHVADYYFELVKWLGIKPDKPDPVLPVPDPLKKRVTQLLNAEGIHPDNPFIVLQPFSLWQYKELHPEKYVDMVNRIAGRSNIPILLSGAPNERHRAQEIADRCTGQIINMAGLTTIGELAGLLSLASLFIGVDSAGVHIAAATGTPTVSIFGPSAPSSWAPRGNRHLVIQPELACVPCRRKGCDDSGVSRCLEALSVDEIMDAAEPILSKRFLAQTDR
ncbi:putative lipopolysaccharide heptosyltransferase III [Desulfosarcina widdelii]|uniref:Putative lipopolysaccharide heptosyltransferase III n=1 Tax=Desulfosarcina widdelii TaxID=947919 RepID=A0A5K7ZI24_9BACT|nr:glycosyltransferase family 9 protein [Desulfosarcina widdelii]BBO79303.1 putative lipopolysaccharide heptosyltransferase III [Desulfosarcina widdelii]